MKKRYKPNYTAGAAIIIMCLTGFAVIAFLVNTNRISAFDDIVYGFFYDRRTPALTAVLKPLTYLGNWQAIVGVSLFMLIIPPLFRSFGLPAAGPALVTEIVKSAGKNLIKRQRPDKAFHLIEQGGFSFPSGHASVSLAFYGMIIYSARRALLENESDSWNRLPSNIGFSIKKSTKVPKGNRIKANIITMLGILIIFLIGISRIYLGVHYPSDVLAGWFLGGALLTASVMVQEYLKAR